MENNISVSQAHSDHLAWLKDLNFYNEEILIFLSHLSEVKARNNKVEVTDKIDFFNNQFVRQQEVIAHLKEEINIAETQLAGFAKAEPTVDFDAVPVDDRMRLEEKMESFTRSYQQLKEEFRQFEGQYL